MSLLNKIAGNGRIAEVVAAAKPSFRFGGGFQQMGFQVRPADKRTVEQLRTNIDYFADKMPEVANFRTELKSMKPEHLGLASDICELGSRLEMLNTAINIRKPSSNGKSLLAYLIEILPKASKENPEMLDFTKEVLNYTDSTASKYFLGSFAGVFEHPETAEHLAATQPLIRDIAESTLCGGYTMDYSKERKFVNALSNYVNPSVKPENIKLVKEAMDTVERLPKNVDLDCAIDADKIVKSPLPAQQMRENLSTFEQIAEGLSKKTKYVDLSEFVTKNVNLY